MTLLSTETVLQGLQQLPSFSGVLTELLESFEQENIGIPQLVVMIGSDPGLSARILRVANSPFYGFSSRIGSIKEAVVVLGFNAVRSIAIAAEIIDSFDGLDCRAFWLHSIGTGFCAKVIAKRVDLDEETAFTAGLVHDLGKLVLEMHFRKHFRLALDYCREKDCEPVEAEKSTLGIDHGMVGFEIAKRWKFPHAIQMAIRNHHAPEGGLLTDIVHVANVVSHALEIGNSGYDFVPNLSPSAWERLGLDFSILKKCFGEMERLSASSCLFLNKNPI